MGLPPSRIADGVAGGSADRNDHGRARRGRPRRAFDGAGLRLLLYVLDQKSLLPGEGVEEGPESPVFEQHAGARTVGHEAYVDLGVAPPLRAPPREHDQIGGEHDTTVPTCISSPSTKRSKKRPPTTGSRKMLCARSPPYE